MLTSSPAQASFIKYILFVIGSILIIGAAYSFFEPFDKQIDEYTTQKSTNLDSLILLCIGSILILANILYYHKIHVIGINMQQFQILNSKNPNAQNESFEWQDISKLYRLRFISPPLYLLKIKKSGRVIIFPTEHSRGKYASLDTPFGSFINDFSEMGKEIKRIKSSYNI